MKAGLFAGGASHVSHWVGYVCESRKEYDSYRGTSGGAGIALFSALGKVYPIFYDYLEYIYSNLTNRSMYGIISPIDSDGKFREKIIAAYFLRRKNYLFDISKEIDAVLSKYFKEEHFKALVKNGIDVTVTSNNIDIVQSPTKYISTLTDGMTYDIFKKFVVSSHAIPLLSKPVDILGYQHCDGGITDNSPTRGIEKFDHADLYLCSSIVDDLEHYKKASTKFQVLMSSVMKARLDQSTDDISRVEKLKSFNVYKIEKKLGFQSANFDKSKMRQAIQMGKDFYRAEKDGRI